jgi:predicted nucleic acid-binding protein
VANELLLDTGALVSLLDRSQAHHARFVTFFEAWPGEVVSTEAVLTEAAHLLSRTRGGANAALDFILEGGAVLVPSTISSLQRARGLLEQYQDLPMDFADATLVVLAEDLSTDLVFTTDHRDFSVYRIRGQRQFQIKP